MAKKQSSEKQTEPIETEELDIKLTPEQEIFCLEYLKDFNATKAAERAGYSKNSARQIGSENLSKPYIRARLRDAIDEVLGDKAGDIKKIIEELRMIAFSDIKDVMGWGLVEEERESADGSQTYKVKRNKIYVKDSELIGEKSRLISEVSENESMMGISRKVKLHDKMRAIELLGKYYKMFTDKIEHTNPDGNMKPQVFVYLPKNGRESE